MAFDHLVIVAKQYPDEAIQLAMTIAGGVVTALGFAAGAGWWAANTLAKNQLEILQQRREFATQREQSLREHVDAMKAELAKNPSSISAREKAQSLDQALTDFEGARKAVADGYAALEHTFGSVWNGVSGWFSGGTEAATAGLSAGATTLLKSLKGSREGEYTPSGEWTALFSERSVAEAAAEELRARGFIEIEQRGGAIAPTTSGRAAADALPR